MIASRLNMFGANIFWLIGALIVSAVAIFLLIALWTGFNMLRWRVGQKGAERQRDRERFAEDGTRYPPASRGLCASCGTVHAKVFQLPSGERLCLDHYAERSKQTEPMKTNQ